MTVIRQLPLIERVTGTPVTQLIASGYLFDHREWIHALNADSFIKDRAFIQALGWWLDPAGSWVGHVLAYAKAWTAKAPRASPSSERLLPTAA